MKKLLLPLFALPLLSGCTGTSAPTAGFSLSAAPGTVMLANGGTPQLVSLVAIPANGFSAAVNVSLGTLPTGVTATPTTLTLMPGQIGNVMLTASGAPVSAAVPLNFTGTSGSLTRTASANLAISAALTSVSLSGSSFDFGGDLLGSTISQSVVTVTNTGSTALTLNPTVTGDPSFSLTMGSAASPSSACTTTLAASASCSVPVAFAPLKPGSVAGTLNLGLGNVLAGSPQTIALTASAAALPAGTVSSTANPQVALYTMTLPYPGAVTVNFGPDTSYGRQTWSESTATAGGQVKMLVAGMLPNTTYHMQATVQLASGAVAKDVDHTFAAKAPLLSASLSVQTTPGMTPQSGIELLNTSNAGFGNSSGLIATDLAGKIIWSYITGNDIKGSQIQGAKQLANGHMLLCIGSTSSAPLLGTPQSGEIVAIREIDLAGDIIREISINALNEELSAQGTYQGPVLQLFHHDVTVLPNGHWIVLANGLVPYTDLAGLPGTTNVLGDVIVDLDENLQPTWEWSSFDYLDVNRHPMLFPDWTHANAVVYSPDDGNLIVSMRHQSWILKIDYRNGTGAGDILWRLGEGGDFTLVGGVDPTDWFYSQHYPSFFTKNTSGVFQIGMMDNGDARQFPAQTVCGTAGAPACLYSSIPVLELDEAKKTATYIFHQILALQYYSFFGGSVDQLANGHVEYTLSSTAGGGGRPSDSDIFEVTEEANPQTVWHTHITSANTYRGVRLPSLYPGVQW